ncbi:MAG: hypothetical protein K9L89_06915 [Kiritimatiellales bacterium]|nr:hypothetical protein [Kiritimatiellales bacterium]
MDILLLVLKESPMGKINTRRINPVSHVAALAVTMLVVFEVLVMAGVLELKAQTVAKYAPWAYEPFLKLIGEHPDSASRWAAAVEESDAGKEKDAVAYVAGIAPSALPILIETNSVVPQTTNAVPELSVPPEEAVTNLPPVAPVNAPQPGPEDIVPVG